MGCFPSGSPKSGSRYPTKLSTQPTDGRRGHSIDVSLQTDLDSAVPEGDAEFDPSEIEWEAYDVGERIETTANSHRFPDVLYALYWQEGLSQPDIGARFDITQQGVSYWMDKYEIPVRDRGNNVTYWNPALSGDLEPDDHPRFRVMVPDEDGEGERQLWFYEHQLIALGNGATVDEIFGDEGTVCHHMLPHGVSVNTPQAIEVLTRSEHRAKHAADDVHTDWAEIEAEIDGDDDS